MLQNSKREQATVALKKKYRIDAKDINKKDHQQLTPLLKAIYKKQPEKVKILLAAGADIEKTNKRKQTALHIAIALDQYAIVTLLMPYRPNVQHQSLEPVQYKPSCLSSGKSSFKCTPLLLALIAKFFDIAALIIVDGYGLISAPDEKQTKKITFSAEEQFMLFGAYKRRPPFARQRPYQDLSPKEKDKLLTAVNDIIEVRNDQYFDTTRTTLRQCNLFHQGAGSPSEIFKLIEDYVDPQITLQTIANLKTYCSP